MSDAHTLTSVTPGRTASGINSFSSKLTARCRSGTLGLAKDVPVGFQNIRLRLVLDTDATDEQLATLLRLTERYCVVYQTLVHPPAIAISRQ